MKIVLAVDGSSHSQYAEEVLKGFPFKQQPEVVIISVCPVPDLHFLGSEVTIEVNRIIDTCRSEASEVLGEAADRCRQWCSSVETQLLDGEPGRRIITAAEKLNADLIILGAKGRSEGHGSLMGSVSERVAKYARSSVLVTRPLPEKLEAGIERILLASDGSQASLNTALRLSNFSLESLKGLTLMTVVEAMSVFGLEFHLQSNTAWEKKISDARVQLEQLAEPLRRSLPEVETFVEGASHVAEKILEKAVADQAELIMLGGTGLSGWERVLLGSVTHRVLHQANCSVWIERQPEPEEAVA